MKKTLASFLLVIVTAFALPAHADYSCLAPYPTDRDYATEEVAFQTCQTDNYNMDECNATVSTKGTYAWNEKTHTCILTCKPGYYMVLLADGSGSECDGSGITQPEQPAPIMPTPITTTVQEASAVPPSVTSPAPATASTEEKPTVISAVAITKKATMKSLPSSNNVETTPAPATTSTTTIATTSPTIPSINTPRPNLFEKVTSFLRKLFSW